jgi:hypothetical protein
MPVLRRWLIAALLLLFVGCPAEDVPTPVRPLTTPQGPSQTEAEAERDGVPADIAALTLDERLDLGDERADGTTSLTADDGVWRLARPTKDYGEVLLLDARREHVQYAVPLGFLPYHLEIADEDIWVAAEDRKQWVRIDSDSLEIVERGTKGPSATPS